MKELHELNLPEDIRYAKDHEWARRQNDTFTIGIDDYAQDQLGDIVFVELPEVGTSLEQGEEFGTVESVKAVSELYIPMAGKVVAVNQELEESPELVNNDPYGKGWMIQIKAADPAQFDSLMDKTTYLEMLKGL